METVEVEDIVVVQYEVVEVGIVETVVDIANDHLLKEVEDIVEMEADTDEDLLLEVEDIVEIHQHQEMVDMMELVLRVEIVLHVHHDVMMDILHVHLVMNEEKVDIVDIVMVDEIVHIILMKEEAHMVHNNLYNP